MNVALSVEQKILGKDAPLTTFGNDVIDDLLRDNWNLFYLASPSFTETPPEGREINRRLLEYFTSDPQWTMYHIFFANRKVASAAAAVTLTEKMMEIQSVAEAMSEMAQSEQAQQESDELTVYVEGGDPPPSAYPDDSDDGEDEGQGSGGYGDSDEDEDGDDSDSDGDGDSDGDEDGDDGYGDDDDDDDGQSDEPMSREDAKEKAEQKEKEAKDHREKAEHAMRDFEDNYFNGIQRSASVKQSGEFGEDVQSFLASWGLDEGEGYELSIEEIRMMMRLMKDAKIMQLTSLMGRFYGIAAHALAGRAPIRIYSKGAGLTQDIPQLFPTEIAKLHPSTHPAVRKAAIEEFIINGMQGIIQTSEAKREGAFIFAVDKSGSMRTHFDETSKLDTLAAALSLGLANAAKLNGQLYRGFGFGSAREYTDIVDEGTPIANLIKFAINDFGGGTEFSPAMQYAFDIFDALDENDKQGCDVLFITDGQSDLDDKAIERLEEYRAQYGVRLWVLLLSTYSNHALEDVADKVLLMTDFDVLAETLANLIFVEQ
jgi:uncharacterized protein with von Willebrand factor type A (vWA) domain